MTSYTLFGQPATPATLAADASAYTLGLQFATSVAGSLTGLWFYSAAGAGVLPQTIALYEVSGQDLVTSQAATWSGDAGSGWVFAEFTDAVALDASTAYEACMLQDTAADWYASTADYWVSGAGADGITSGPLSAPSNADSTGGQSTYALDNTLTYPSSGGGGSYWIDVEVELTGAAVVQTCTGTQGTNAGFALAEFDDTPADGDVLLFFVAVNHAAAADINAGPGVQLLLDSGGTARVYATIYAEGDTPQWGFGVQGATIAVIGYDIDPAGPIASVLDMIPAWGEGTTGPATDGQPTVDTSAAAAGGVAISFLTQDSGDYDVTQAGGWGTLTSETSSDCYLYAATQTADASSSETADWAVSGQPDYFPWEGIVLVVPANSGTDPPAPTAGAAQFALPLSEVTLTGAPGFADGHSGTVAWTAPQGAPAITSGADTDTATIASIGAPHTLTTWQYTFTATQDDGQIVSATAAVTVPPPGVFQAFGSAVDVRLLQTQFSNPASLDSATSTVAIETTAGSTLVLAIVARVGADTPLALVSVADTSETNTWQYSTDAASQSPPANGSYYALNGYYGFAAIACITDAAAVTEITAELSETIDTAVNGLFCLVAYEFAGVPAGAAIDGAASDGASYTYEISPAIYTAGIPADIVVVAADANAGFEQVTPGTIYVLGPAGNTAYGIVASPGPQSCTLTGPYDEEINGWAILGIGNPVFQGIAWYGTGPVEHASGGEWG